MRYFLGITYLSWIGVHWPGEILLTSIVMGVTFGVFDLIVYGR